MRNDGTSRGLAATFAFTGSAAAHADETSSPVPSGAFVDNSFDSHDHVQIVGSETPPAHTKAICPDRNYVALGYVWTNSVDGCSVVGTNSSVKVGYAWRANGSGNALINGGCYNHQKKATWYTIPGNRGGTKQLPWGNVAASKMIQGISIEGVPTKILFS